MSAREDEITLDEQIDVMEEHIAHFEPEPGSERADAIRAAILTSLLRLRTAGAQEWQPIESAPKDGRSVLLHRPGYTTMGYLDCVEQKHRCSSLHEFCNPTHWRPLPPPPKGDAT